MNTNPFYKIFILFIVCFFALIVGFKTIFAAGTVSLSMTNWVNLALNDVSAKLPTITIIDEGGGNITPTYGVRIMLPKDADVLWDKNTTQLTINGILANVNYDKTLKILQIPVAETFTAGKTLVISGQAVMTYNNGSSYKNLTLDINGDSVADATGNNGLQIDATLLRTDQSPPFPIHSLTYKPLDSSVVLSWENPPDPDLYAIILTRTLTRGTSTPTSTDITIDHLTSTYTDTLLQPGDKLQYSIRAKDNVGNLSNPVTISVEISLPETPAALPVEENIPALPIENDVTAEEQKSILDSITEEDINNVLSKYKDINKDTQNLKELVYFVKAGIIKGQKGKINFKQPLTYGKLATFLGKAFSIKQKGGYFHSLKLLGHISSTAKANVRIKKKTAFKILLELKGIDYATQTIAVSNTLKGNTTLTDIAVWSVKVIDQGS
ncbi:fibronectin type III domain-containing protein [Candidatus Peregrinibacteria bacterium]|nr:fibronectin type III domain-containing protein [Candidatus Peregrinibacteria bacterium]